MASKKENLPVRVKVSEDKEQGSSITYAPEVLNVIAQAAVNEVEGVAGISNPSGGLLRKNSTSKGLRIEQSPEEVAVECYVIVEYDRPIQKVAQEVQENVRKTVESMTGMHVVRVDVHVTGVSFKKENTAVANAAQKARLNSRDETSLPEGKVELSDADEAEEAEKK